MLFLRQKLISRSDLQYNRSLLYVFGDNLERQGRGGQAKEMRGEPNSFGVATKRKMDHGYPECYFHDKEHTAYWSVDEDFDKLEEVIKADIYDGVVFPFDGIGTGLSMLPEYAPNLLRHIVERINQIENSLTND